MTGELKLTVQDGPNTPESVRALARDMLYGQVPPDHPDADKPVPWGEHPRSCDCGDCP